MQQRAFYWRTYSITLSVRSISDCGIVMAGDLAVFELITNSKLFRWDVPGLGAAKDRRNHLRAATKHPGEAEAVGHQSGFGPLRVVERSANGPLGQARKRDSCAQPPGLMPSTATSATNSRRFIR